MAPLALYNPGTLFGIQIAAAAVVFCALYFPTKNAQLASALSAIALAGAAVGTTFMARVPWPTAADTATAAKPGKSELPWYVFLAVPVSIVSLFGFVVSGSMAGVTEPPVFLYGLAGMAVLAAWVFSSLFYKWRGDRARANGAPSAPPAKKK